MKKILKIAMIRHGMIMIVYDEEFTDMNDAEEEIVKHMSRDMSHKEYTVLTVYKKK